MGLLLLVLLLKLLRLLLLLLLLAALPTATEDIRERPARGAPEGPHWLADASKQMMRGRELSSNTIRGQSKLLLLLLLQLRPSLLLAEGLASRLAACPECVSAAPSAAA